MTPPQRKKSFTIPLTFPLAASALALSLLSLPAQATLSNPPARASLEGLRLVGEATVPTLRDMVVRAGMEAIGTPYSWGGDDPEDGFDCSGLVLFVYREIAGVNLPRTARARWDAIDYPRRDLCHHHPGIGWQLHADLSRPDGAGRWY